MASASDSAAEAIVTRDLARYFARNGKRFRSLGEIGITFPVDSPATTVDAIIEELASATTEERAGRAMDHEGEDAFERLRAGGYM